MTVHQSHSKLSEEGGKPQSFLKKVESKLTTRRVGLRGTEKYVKKKP